MDLPLMDRAQVDSRIRSLIEPFNKKRVAIADDTTFAGDLEFDSLTVMDFVAAIEDEFDIIISMNQQAEIENYGQLVDAVCKLQAE
jgi:acyl carrier protein